MCKNTCSVMAKYTKQFFLTSKVLQQLITTENSCVEIENHKRHMTLFPYHMKNVSASIREILDEDIGKFDKDYDGILLGYKHLKLFTSQGFINHDSSYIHIDIQADFVLFKPASGKELPAIVTKKSRDHVSCLVYHTFNVSLPKPEGIECWTGSDVEIGEEIIIKVTYAKLDARLPYIKGEFLNNISEYATSINEKPVNKKLKFDEEDEMIVEPKVKEKKKRKYSSVEEDNENIGVKEEIDNSISRKKERKYSSVEEDNENIGVKEEIDNSISKKKKRKYSSVEEDNENIGVKEEIDNSISKKKKRKYSSVEEDNENIGVKEEIDNYISKKKKRKYSSVEEDNENIGVKEEIDNSISKKKKQKYSSVEEDNENIGVKEEIDNSISKKKKKKFIQV